VRLGGLAHDREAQPGARQPARFVGTVEAIEDVREVLAREPGPVVAHDQLAVRQPDLNGLADGTPLESVVDEVGHGAMDSLRLAANHGGLCAEAHGHAPARPRPGALHDRVHHSVQAHVVRHVPGLRAPGQLDDVGHERGQLVELLDDVRPKALALVGREPIRLLECLDVRAQARDRRAELVARVGDQMSLRRHGSLERVEGGVEAARKPGELISSRDLHAL